MIKALELTATIITIYVMLVIALALVNVKLKFTNKNERIMGYSLLGLALSGAIIIMASMT